MKGILAIIILSLSSLCVTATTLSIIITSGPGSNQDTIARIVAPILENELGREVVIISAPGAQGLIGIQKFAMLPADGNTLLMGTMAIPYFAKTGENLNFDILKDFEPLHGLTRSRMQILVRADSPATNMKEFVEWSKVSNGLFGGTSVPATTLFINDLSKSLKAKLILTGYKQTSQIGLDLAAQRLDFTISVVGNASFQPHIDAGKIRVIGYTDTLSKEGFDNLNMMVWSSLMIKAQTPEDIKSRLIVAAEKIVKSQYFKDALASRTEGGSVYDVPSKEIKKRILHEVSLIERP